MITQTEFKKMLTGAEMAELRARYPWAKLDDGKMSQHARAAWNLRKELKLTFPGIEFRVRSNSYSMGDSIHISWTLGPTENRVQAVSRKYQYGWFDGMEDLYNFDHSPESQAVGAILGQSKYVLEQRKIPGELVDQVGKDLCRLQRVEYQGPYTMHLLGNMDGEPVERHARALLWETPFAPGAEYAGVRYMTSEEHQNSPVGVFAVVLFR